MTDSLSSLFCYKCQKEKAVINVRKKACKNCFLSAVEYMFKNTLREKCQFKKKIHNSFSKREFICSTEEETKKEEKKQEDNLGGNIREISNCKELNNASKEKNTAVAFSGGACSCFLLFSFVQYLKNYQNQKNCFYLKNEHAIFSTVLYVDVDEDQQYTRNLENVVRNVWEMTQEEKKNCSKENIKDVESAIVEKNESIQEEKGEVYKIRFGKVNFVILKRNYFVQEKFKNEFQKKYKALKEEKNNYYLDYIKEIIIINNILKYCIKEDINYVLFGNSGNNISEKIFIHTILGNGINIPLISSYIDNRFFSNNVQFIKPLKDILNKEIYIYCFFKNIKYLKEGKIVNILRKSVEEIISNLSEKNNIVSVINNTTNNLLDWNKIFSNYKKKQAKQKPESVTYNGINTTNENEYLMNFRILKMKYFSNPTEVDVTTFLEKIRNIYSEFCYICLGNKETEEQKRFIKKMDKIQKKNLREMKYTHFMCSTCCSIFSSSFSFTELYKTFF